MPVFDVYMNGRVVHPNIDAADAAAAVSQARKCAHTRYLSAYENFLDVARAMRVWRGEYPHQNVVIEAREVAASSQEEVAP